MFNKIIIGLICIFVLIGCNCEYCEYEEHEKTVNTDNRYTSKSFREGKRVIGIANLKATLIYAEQIEGSAAPKYNCVYYIPNGNGSVAFNILSYMPCKEYLD